MSLDAFEFITLHIEIIKTNHINLLLVININYKLPKKQVINTSDLSIIGSLDRLMYRTIDHKLTTLAATLDINVQPKTPVNNCELMNQSRRDEHVWWWRIPFSLSLFFFLFRTHRRALTAREGERERESARSNGETKCGDGKENRAWGYT